MDKKERILLLTLAAINFTNIMDFMIMMPLGPQLMRIFEITPQQFGLLVSCYTISAGISGFFAAFLIDRFDRKRALTILYIGFIIGTFICGLAPGYKLLMSARVFTGIFGGVLGAVILSIVGDVVPLERRGQAMGMIMGAFSVASVFGVPFGLFMAANSTLGWHAPFLLLGICGIPIGFLIFKYVPHLRQHVKLDSHIDPIAVLKAIGSSRNQIFALILMAVIMMGHFSIIPFLSPYMVSNVGFKEADLAYIYIIGGGLTIFTSPYIGKLADRKGKFKVFRVFVLLSTLPIFLITHMPQVNIVWALSVTALFFVFSGGRFGPAQAMVTSAVNPQIRGSFMSISSSLQQLTAGLASYLAGVIVTKSADGSLQGYNIVGYIAFAFTLGSIFIARKLKTFDGQIF
ncbi:MAG: MFS transporter [Bacteroidia bacterium]|nr:MFS transporter [Bacteroidia bacterium]